MPAVIPGFAVLVQFVLGEEEGEGLEGFVDETWGGEGVVLVLEQGGVVEDHDGC